MLTNEALFFNGNKIINKNQAIKDQCQDGDILHIRKEFQYKIQWNSQTYDYSFYTNITYGELLQQFLTAYHLASDAASKNAFYFAGVSTSAQIPFQGVPNVLFVKSRQSF